MPNSEFVTGSMQMAAEQRMIDADVMIGPPPPEMVQEAEAIPGDARSAEVVRVLKYDSSKPACASCFCRTSIQHTVLSARKFYEDI